jgi:hypothetical protein
MRGKYSPTVSNAYAADQNWWVPVATPVDCNGEVLMLDGQYDAEGYDSYGYNKDDVDRAGNQEHVYYGDWVDGYDYAADLYEDLVGRWNLVDGKLMEKA